MEKQIRKLELQLMPLQQPKHQEMQIFVDKYFEGLANS